MQDMGSVAYLIYSCSHLPDYQFSPISHDIHAELENKVLN